MNFTNYELKNDNLFVVGCNSSIWFHGLVATVQNGRYQMEIYADGNIRGQLFQNYEQVLEFDDPWISSKLLNYISSDKELDNLIHYGLFYDEDILNDRNGNVLFLDECNVFSGTIVDLETGEEWENIEFDEDDIWKIINDPNLFDLVVSKN